MTENASQKLPLVSIGVPIYNEARHLRESLNALLAQDYPNLEIIISDNMSNDDSRQICEELAGNDPRVRFCHTDTNIGAAKNSIRVWQEASGKYFMWASGHDLWSSNCISECVKMLEECPNASIAFSSGYWIDENSQPMDQESGWTDTRGMDSIERFFTVLWGNMHPVLGVIRVDYLADIDTIGAHSGADLVVLAELVFRGDFLHAAKAHWCRREHRQTPETHAMKVARYRSSEFGLATSHLSRMFPMLHLPVRLLAVVWRASLPLGVRLLVMTTLVLNFPIRYFAARRRLATQYEKYVMAVTK